MQPSTATEDDHLLIVDDDPRIRSMLSEYLSEQGFRVSTVQDGREMWDFLEQTPVDAILLDLVLPGGDDGLTLAARLRVQYDIPIIMLTGRGDVVDRVVGLEMGADDYLAKPFHLREVLARIRSVLRRARAQREVAETEPAPATVQGRHLIAFDGWQLNLQRRQLINPEGREIALTTGEYDLLLAFVQNPNRVLDRDRLMDLAKGRQWEAYDRSVDAQVGRLRRKVESDPKNPTLIKAVRGVGYIFVAEVTQK